MRLRWAGAADWRILSVAAALTGPVGAHAQEALSTSHDHAAAPRATAVRTTATISIDGIPDEAAWLAAPAITKFTQIKPDERAPVTERTEVRILYDEDNLYVGGWLYDGGAIITQLGRRDMSLSQTDNLIFFLDTFHDHRTAYRFTANPSGVKRDEIVTIGGSSAGGTRYTGTGLGDTSWDPVWELATSVTGEGWFLEMRIPFAQLNFPAGDEQRWGLQVDRRIARDLEHSSWSFTPAVELATVARFGHLDGIRGIRRGGRLELLPFVAARAEYRPVLSAAEVDFANPYRSGRDYFGNAGLDLKYRLSSNITLNATVNPDFGQVEIDPADLNLTAYESRFNEQRPFFVEGGELFRFGRGGGGGPSVVYTRRIGRSPQLSLPDGVIYSDVPGTTTILGALKMTGKSSGGWSFGLLDAVTRRESAPYVDRASTPGEALVEPATNYFVGRVRRDANQGRTSYGAMLASVARDLEGHPAATARLHSQAITGGLDLRHELPSRQWTIAAEATPSLVRGDPAAILRTQRTSARYFQRPDATHLELDPDATSILGYGARVALEKTSGAWDGGVRLLAQSPGLELNDLGYQTDADRLGLEARMGYLRERVGRHLRSWSVNLSPAAGWNYGGDLLDAAVELNGSMELLGFHTVNLGLSKSGSTWSDRLTRGGPLTRSPGSVDASASFNSDRTRRWAFRVGTSGSRDEAGGWRASVNGGVTARPGETLEVRVSPSFTRRHQTAQYVASVADTLAAHTFGRRYLFGSLDQATLALETRINLTVSPTLTLEVFAEPFLSRGDYGAFKELARPRSYDFLEYGRDVGESGLDAEGRYAIDPDGSGPAPAFSVANQDFTYHSLLGNAVLRWEWRAGSTLFLVWQQSRTERLTNAVAGTGTSRGLDFEKDVRALLGIRPENVLMMKVNFWTTR